MKPYYPVSCCRRELQLQSQLLYNQETPPGILLSSAIAKENFNYNPNYNQDLHYKCSCCV